MDSIGIGMLGLGTVGRGVIRVLDSNARDIEGRLGARLNVSRIAVKHLEKDRGIDLDKRLLTPSAEEVIDDPAIQIVVELVGGVGDAASYVFRAIDRGKHVVTANKALLATRGDEVFARASARGVDVFFEGAVCGGIPIIRALRESLASERIHSIAGILNGTTNYILTSMAKSEATFAEALEDAQRRGYAEADPASDLDGHDAAQKLAILASLGFSTRLSESDVAVEGIRDVTPLDLKTAQRHGYTIKLMAIADRNGEAIAARVHPCWVRKDTMLAHVDGVLNAVLLESAGLGTSMFLGRGAGDLPTGSAVVSDLIDLARNIRMRSTGRIPHLATRDEALVPARALGVDELTSAFYLCFEVLDRPGVLAAITGILGEERVSLRVVHQDAQGEMVDVPVMVVVLTHPAVGRAVQRAVERIDALATTKSRTRAMRILS